MAVPLASPSFPGDVAVELVGAKAPVVAQVQPEPAIVGAAAVVAIRIVAVDPFQPAADVIAVVLRLEEAAVCRLAQLFLLQLSELVIRILRDQPFRAVLIIDRGIDLHHPARGIQLHIRLHMGVAVGRGSGIGMGQIGRDHLVREIMQGDRGILPALVIIALRLNDTRPVVIEGGRLQPVAPGQIVRIFQHPYLRTCDQPDGLHGLFIGGFREGFGMLVRTGVDPAVAGGGVLFSRIAVVIIEGHGQPDEVVAGRQRVVHDSHVIAKGCASARRVAGSGWHDLGREIRRIGGFKTIVQDDGVDRLLVAVLDRVQVQPIGYEHGGGW